MIIRYFKIRAFSLLEMMVVISILAIIAAYGFPSLNNTIQSTKITTYVNSIVGGIALAQQASLQNDKTSIFCPSNDSTSCSSLASDLKNGWMIYIDDNNNKTFDTGEKVISTEISGLGSAAVIKEALGTQSFSAIFYPQQENYYSAANDLTLTFCAKGIFPVVFSYSSLKKRGSVKTDRSVKCS